MPTTGAWFADEVAATLSSVPGSPEREHVLALLRRASRIRLDGAVARAAADTVLAAPGSIESNLGRVPAMDGIPLWIEAPHKDRLRTTETPGVPEVVGILLASDPGQPTHVVSFLSWRLGDGSVHHSYALLHWDLERLGAAQAAATGRDGGAEERMMALASADVPPGFAAEMEIWQNIPADDVIAMSAAIRQTCRDMLGEHLFLLSVLLLLNSSAVELDEADGGPDEGFGGAPCWSARMSPATGRRTPGRRAGFRKPLFGGPLAWSPPT